jgi:hypothetical protein
MNSEGSLCRHCGVSLRHRTPICFSCGTIYGGLHIECENHPDEPASHLCVVCGKPVCDDCSTSLKPITLCDDPEHRTLYLQWSVVFETSFEFEADAIEKNLQQAGIRCRVFRLSDHVATFGIEQMHRTRVMVPKEQTEEAAALLQHLRLTTDPDAPSIS